MMDSVLDGNLTVDPNSLFTLTADDNRHICTIKRDGTVELADGVTPDVAAQVFWNFVRKQIEANPAGAFDTAGYIESFYPRDTIGFTCCWPVAKALRERCQR